MLRILGRAGQPASNWMKIQSGDAFVSDQPGQKQPHTGVCRVCRLIGEIMSNFTWPGISVRKTRVFRAISLSSRVMAIQPHTHGVYSSNGLFITSPPPLASRLTRVRMSLQSGMRCVSGHNLFKLMAN